MGAAARGFAGAARAFWAAALLCSPDDPLKAASLWQAARASLEAGAIVNGPDVAARVPRACHRLALRCARAAEPVFGVGGEVHLRDAVARALDKLAKLPDSAVLGSADGAPRGGGAEALAFDEAEMAKTMGTA